MTNSALLRLRPSTFVPSVTRGIDHGTSVNELFDSTMVADSALGNTGSFRYDPPGTGVKSTQQLNVDWSKFSNHTFFHSAQVKVNTAFDKIVDRYPFDGTRKETELYFDQLTGWDKYVYDQFPKNKGYLFFSGSANTYVTVKDAAGAAFPAISRTPDGAAVLNPGDNSMTLEFHLHIPSGSNTSQFICQKVHSGNGFYAAISGSSSPASCSFVFGAVSGSSSLAVTASINKARWNHLSVVWDREKEHRASVRVNQTLEGQSDQVEIGDINFNPASFYIGSGSAVGSITPTATLSGALDELRVWHTVRTPTELLESEKKAVFSQTGLMLYMKFNEPSGSNSTLVLDHSGKGIHGILTSSVTIRNFATSSLVGSDPMTYERLADCPVLFPETPGVGTLRSALLVSASLYDSVNPNIITKLVPRHFFLEGQLHDSLDTEGGAIETDLDSGTDPGTVKLGNTQLLLSLLYVWATFFDELKLHLDSFSTLNHVDYDSEDTIPDQFLQHLASKYGITLPPLFVGSSISQFINGENVDNTVSNNDYSLQYLQNQLWRRILINIRDMQTSKGTLHSIKSFIRSVGIEPDSNFRIREHGGPTHRSLNNARESRSEVASMLSFVSGGYAFSPFLSGARLEPGFPATAGNSGDGLFTSGSFTYEGICLFPGGGSYSLTQSLGRLSTLNASNQRFILANLVALSGSGLTLFVKPTTSSVTALSMSVGSFDPLDGKVWNFSFGRTRGDQLGTVSSSYFLRAARSLYGEIIEEYTTSSFYDDSMTGNHFQTRSSSLTTTSGAFLEVGSGSAFALGSGAFLNAVGGAATTEVFGGRISEMRFWSKDLSITESREHTRNFKSLGVANPKINFNFDTIHTGSFERLRLDVSTDQPDVSSSGTGTIQVFDFSQNNLHLSGSGFPATSSVVVPHRFWFSQLSPKFDVGATNNKVRVRSFLNFDNVLNSEDSYATVAPVYSVPRSELPTDNNRLSIDFSMSDALDQDIMCLFATLEEFDNAIGDPTLMFSPDYPTLENLRKIYFHRLTSKLNVKGFFEFYKWFDTNLGSFIAQLLPRKTSFSGTRFIVESHALERAKFEYKFEDIYLGDNMRLAGKNRLLLSQFAGSFKRY